MVRFLAFPDHARTVPADAQADHRQGERDRAGRGLELLAALDTRFCSLENTRLGQPEVPLGVIPGGVGTAPWPRLIGYARAAELILSGADFDVATAERYGMVNRALPAAELDPFVDALAQRIAGFPQHSVALAKQVVRHEGTLADALAL